MSTEAVSAEKLESTRKFAARLESEILRRLAHVKQESAAECMGVHASTGSRLKDGMEPFCQLLAALGLQLTPKDSVVTSRQDQKALKRMACNWLLAELEAEES